MTDQEKFKKLFDELGIEYEENGNTLFIDTFNCDGAREFGISFWDGDYYPEGSFHEFWVVPDIDHNTVDEKIIAELKALRCVMIGEHSKETLDKAIKALNGQTCGKAIAISEDGDNDE